MAIVLTKGADKEVASLGEEIEYRVVVHNTGTVQAQQVVFKDELSKSIALVPRSVVVNGEGINDVAIEKGLDIGTLLPGEKTLIFYRVKVIGGACHGKIKTHSYVLFEYRLPDKTTESKESNKVTTCVRLDIAIFNQMIRDKFCLVPFQKPDIEEVDEIHVDAEVFNAYVIKTHQGKSNEGQVLSGYKLIVNGVLRIGIEYTADSKTQPIHSYHCELPFGDFVILPPDYMMGREVKVEVKVEEVDAEKCDRRGVWVNIVCMIIAKVCL